MASIGPLNTPSSLLAQSLQQAARRSGSEALRDLAAQMAARGASQPTPATTTPATVASELRPSSAAAPVQPDEATALRRPGSVLDIRV